MMIFTLLLVSSPTPIYVIGYNLAPVILFIIPIESHGC